METKNNGGLLIGILIGIIIVLLVVTALFATGTFEFKTKITNDAKQTNDKITVEENDELSDEEDVLAIGKELYDKATKVFETWQLLPYCGERPTDGKILSFKSGSIMYETNFKNLDELKKYLASFLSDKIINSRINEQPITDVSILDNPEKAYTNYLITDGKLYCRSNTGKGWLSRYLNSYDMQVDTIKDDIVKFDVKIANVNEKVALQSDSKCTYGSKISDCTDEQIEYVNTKFIIKKVNNNWVVTDYTLHG